MSTQHRGSGEISTGKIRADQFSSGQIGFRKLALE